MGIYRRKKQWWISYALGETRRDEPAGAHKAVAERLLELREAQVRLGLYIERRQASAPAIETEPEQGTSTERLEIAQTLTCLVNATLAQASEIRSLQATLDALRAKLDRLTAAPPSAEPSSTSVPSTAIAEPRYLTVKQAAAYLGLSPKGLYHRVHMGTIPYRKTKGRLIFDRLNLDRWIAKAPGVSVQEALRDW